MNFIFGIIILALFILAVRVIWATSLQTIGFLKSGIQLLSLKLAQRSSRSESAVVQPCLPADAHWEIMADTVRREIHQRNTGLGDEVDRLDRQLQARLKTIELIKVNIQIAKLEQELLKVKPAMAMQEPAAGKKRRRLKQPPSDAVEDIPSTTPSQVHQLRAALKGGLQVNPANESYRH